MALAPVENSAAAAIAINLCLRWVMLLFLDFDGVLHPRATKNLLVHVPRIEGVLRDFPHVLTVISSSWREEIHLHEIQSMFSEDLRHRIIGTTPLVEIDYPPGPAGSREDEIQIYMAQPECADKQWLALDDEAPLFSPRCPNLILCNSLTGLDDEVERQLREKLSQSLLEKMMSAAGTEHVTPADSNIFADLGFEPEEAAKLLAESDLIISEKLGTAGNEYETE
ncbi:MAG: HAD domain-containing protein [Sulfurimicrobium sp.]|nr:HAD domain-containing protein [Sulfurimicrobium sp.]